jgi:hypothetical protein
MAADEMARSASNKADLLIRILLNKCFTDRMPGKLGEAV